MKTTKTQTQIQQAVIYRCTDKESREVFYLVKSDSSDQYYQVRWNEQVTSWQCNCISHKPCKHERAVREVQAARVENSKQQVATPAAPAQARVVQAYGNAGIGFYAEQLVNGQWTRFPDAETGKHICHPRKGSAEAFLKEQEQDAKRAAYNAAFDPCLVA